MRAIALLQTIACLKIMPVQVVACSELLFAPLIIFYVGKIEFSEDISIT